MVFQCITGVSLIPNIRYKYQHSSADMQNVSNLPKVSMGHISSDWMYKLVLKRWASISVVVNLKYFSFLFLLFTFLAVKLFHFFSQQSQNAAASLVLTISLLLLSSTPLPTQPLPRHGMLEAAGRLPYFAPEIDTRWTEDLGLLQVTGNIISKSTMSPVCLFCVCSKKIYRG